jgi:hypothetical protein
MLTVSPGEYPQWEPRNFLSRIPEEHPHCELRRISSVWAEKRILYVNPREHPQCEPRRASSVWFQYPLLIWALPLLTHLELFSHYWLGDLHPKMQDFILILTYAILISPFEIQKRTHLGLIKCSGQTTDPHLSLLSVCIQMVPDYAASTERCFYFLQRRAICT